MTAAACQHSREQREACDLPECTYCAVCGLGTHTDFVERVKNWMNEESVVHEGLAHEGKKMIAGMMKYVSLREIARRSGLSPTYLSLVVNGKTVISPGAFIRVAELMNPFRG